MSEFELVPGLAKKDFIIDLPLSRVLMNDKKDFPWVFLVPRKPNIVQMNQLSKEDQHQLTDEITLASNVMESLFETDRINVAAIGNKTPQLHVHVICRKEGDPHWPDVCWNKDMETLSEEERADLVQKIKAKFEELK